LCHTITCAQSLENEEMMFRSIGKFVVWLFVFLGVLGGVFFSWWQGPRLSPVPKEALHLRGRFGPVVAWPLLPLHVLPLPDGRVISYGTDGKGRQGGKEIYDVWNPAKGTGPDAHLLLPNQTGTDIFCTGQLLVPGDSAVLLVGGDRTINGVRNYSSPDINYFYYDQNNMKSAGRTMERPRWYPTVMTLANSDVLVLGGRLDPTHFAPIPELYEPSTHKWRTYPGLDKDILFGAQNWNYPRAWQREDGKLFSLSRTGETFTINLEGEGSYVKESVKLPQGHAYLPTLMYAPGKLLTTRLLGKTFVVDINGDHPTAESTGWSGFARVNSMATVMADGKVFLSGGGFWNNDSTSKWHIAANRLSAIWDPSTGSWSDAAPAEKHRLYHSVALLMPDATVLTGGGGSPNTFLAPNNLNAEVYYPPYLFKKDGSGEFAERPKIKSAPDQASYGAQVDLGVDAQAITRVTFIKVASATHAQVFDQRYMELKIVAKEASKISVQMPDKMTVAPPGFYQVFVFNQDGTPSVAKILRLQ
jgi:hypothetical protein